MAKKGEKRLMVKAGALYFSIVVAFFIAIISASLIMVASHYRSSYLKEIRHVRLLNNLSAGLTILKAEQYWKSGTEIVDLYGDAVDSVRLVKKSWGVFDLGMVEAFIQQDTLRKIMLLGKETDLLVMSMADEDRPLSVSGHTKITGNAEVPKSGIRSSYAEGEPYAGEKTVYGKTSYSDRNLKPLTEDIVNAITAALDAKLDTLQPFSGNDLNRSFTDSPLKLRLPKVAVLGAINLTGNLMLYADSLVTISASARLSGLQIYAPTIKIAAGFKGDCQFFATDSIVVGKGAVFNYPSVMGLIRTTDKEPQPTIKLDERVNFNGIIFTYEKKRTPLQMMVKLGKNAKIKGEVFSTGTLQLQEGVTIDGKVSCYRFMMQTGTTLYENYLIDVTFNRNARSGYYLSARLFDQDKANQVLKWLN